MAPEQARGEEVNARADVFSAGVVLAEMIAPKGIKTPKAREAIWQGIHHEPPELPDTPWASVLRKAVARLAEHRYPSASALARALEEVTLQVEGAEDVHPYPGLASFTEEDAAYFFGRELEVEAMWKKLRRPHLLALIGPSGAGKSSFLRAGLLPVMPEGWRVVVCNPGTTPFQNLARSLLPEFFRRHGNDSGVSQHRKARRCFIDLERWRQQHTEVLVIVDQFEELFTLNPSGGPIKVCRASGSHDHRSRCACTPFHARRFPFSTVTHRSLAPIFSELSPLGPPVGAALRRALVQPSLKCGYRFEEESLVEEMIADVSEERGALPMLAFAASRLWEHRDRDRGLLTREAYEHIGGVGGALAQHAEATLEKIGNERIPIVRELFRNLVTAQGTRAARDMDELLSVFQDKDAANDVLRELIDARLLTSFEVTADDEEESRRRVEIIHESLLTAWPRLVRWQTQDEEGAQLRDELRQAAQLWEQHGRSADRLWMGTAVKEYQIWRERYSGGLTSTEEAFAQSMVRHAERRRRRRRIAFAASFGVLLGIVVLVSALWQRSELAREEAVNETLRAEASKLLALGQLEIEGYPTLAVAYALKSLELSDTLEARLFALLALQQGPTALIMRPPEGFEDIGWAHQVCFSPDGSRLAIGGYNTVHIQPQNGEAPLLVCRYPTAGFQVVRPAFSPSGERLVTVKMGDVRIWSVPDFEELGGTKREEGRTGLKMTHNAFYTITEIGSEEFLRRWSFDESEPQLVGRMKAGTAGADIDRAGHWLAYGGGRRIWLRSLNDWDRRQTLVGEHPAYVHGVRFRPDGTQLATSDASGEIRLWSLGSESKEPVRILDGSGLTGLCFDSRGTRLAAFGNFDGGPTARLWNLEDPADAEPTVLGYGEGLSQGFLNGAAFDPRGRWLATANAYSVAFWPVGDRLPFTLTGHEGRVDSVVFTPDGKHLVSASGGDGTVRVWPFESGATSRVILSEDLQFPRISMDPKGKFIVVPARSHVLVVPLEGGTPQKLEGFSSASTNLQVALDPSGHLVAATPPRGPAEDKVIRIWDLESGKSWTLGPLESAGDGYQGYLGNPAFLPGGRLLSSGPIGLQLWNLEDGHMKTLSQEPGYTVVSGDGRFALRSQLWDEQKETYRHIWLDLEKEVSKELSAYGNDHGRPAFDPSGRLALSSGMDGLIRVGPVTGEEPHLFFAHKGIASSVAVSPDYRWIASSGFDGKIRLWPMPDIDQQPFHTLPYEDLLERLRNVTNVRVVEDEASSTGYRIDIAPFPGWEKVPEW